jgi:hypothetical protein
MSTTSYIDDNCITYNLQVIVKVKFVEPLVEGTEGVVG